MPTFRFVRILASALFAAVLLLGSAGTLQAKDLATDTDALARWQMTYDHLSTMSPKWGFQGVEAFKASVDAGVPVVFIDVRTPKEWSEQGIVQGAVQVNLNTLPTAEGMAKLPADKNTIMAVYCKSGHRSDLALTFLQNMGYKNAVSMQGGFEAWKKAGYPIEPAK
jgi:rhodanese-related sulfurtransferase